MLNEIEKLRQELEQKIIMGKTYEEIYEASVTLDNAINNYYKLSLPKWSLRKNNNPKVIRVVISAESSIKRKITIPIIIKSSEFKSNILSTLL